ncbi:MAG: hypothetical protein AAF485_24985, partial [Chloroflexota bacterium]
MIQHRSFRWFLGCVAVVLISPFIYWATGIGQGAAELSAELVYGSAGQPLNSPKAQALHRLLLPMRLERLLLYPLLLITFQLGGGGILLRRWLATNGTLRQAYQWLTTLTRWLPQRWQHRFDGFNLLVILLFVILFNVTIFTLYLPFNFYRGFILAHQFGLSNYTTLGWLSDWGKNVLIALLMDGVIWTGFYALMHLLPRRWPIVAGALVTVFGMLFTILSPVLITPLF